MASSIEAITLRSCEANHPPKKLMPLHHCVSQAYLANWVKRGRGRYPYDGSAARFVFSDRPALYSVGRSTEHSAVKGTK
jgi:hypothetical protein